MAECNGMELLREMMQKMVDLIHDHIVLDTEMAEMNERHAERYREMARKQLETLERFKGNLELLDMDLEIPVLN